MDPLLCILRGIKEPLVVVDGRSGGRRLTVNNTTPRKASIYYYESAKAYVNKKHSIIPSWA